LARFNFLNGSLERRQRLLGRSFPPHLLIGSQLSSKETIASTMVMTNMTMAASTLALAQRRSSKCHFNSNFSFLRVLVVVLALSLSSLNLVEAAAAAETEAQASTNENDNVDKEQPSETCTIAFDGTVTCVPVVVVEPEGSDTDSTVKDGTDGKGSTDGKGIAPPPKVQPTLSPPPMTTTTTTTTTPPPLACGLYLAPSTIPGAGLGIFTALEKEQGDSVGAGDVCLPVMEMNWHQSKSGNNGINGRNNDNNHDHDYFNPFSDYYWAGAVMGMQREVESDDIEAYCPGLDCAINCHLALINVQKSIPLYDTAGMHRHRDPGAGAFTPYHNGTTIVSRHIPAGGELFKFYGDNWFETRPDSFGPTFPLSDDFPVAEALLQQLFELTTTPDSMEEDDEHNNTMQQDLWDIITSLSEPPYAFVSRVLGALPTKLSDAAIANDAGEIAVLHQPAAMRSPEWLQQNGRCIDHMRPGMSTIDQAGHGAFATRDLPIHTVITTSPLHHLPYQEFCNMYKFDLDEEHNRWNKNVDGDNIGDDEPTSTAGYQVLLNYCYSHAETTLLLCPYGAGINYINHQSGKKANVKIQWAEDFPLAHQSQGLNETVESLEWNYQPQFGFDYIAIKNIQEGDELFLDYGDEWEEAWQEHVANYESVGENAERYAAGDFLNEYHPNMPIRTVEEVIFDPYPDHLQIRCHPKLRYYSGTTGNAYHWRTKDYGYPCRVTDRYLEDNQEWYTVQLEIRPDEEDDDEDDDEGRGNSRSKGITWIEKTDVPRSAIHFFDKPGHTDMHLPNAFRHSIGIPDYMIPDIWRNL
jgi:hypothetical protein